MNAMRGTRGVWQGRLLYIRAMDAGQARRVLRRLVDWARFSVGDAGERDPVTGGLIGTLRRDEAVAAGRVVIGPHSYGTFRVRIGKGERGRVQIGDYCSIAQGVEFSLGGNHRVDWVSTYPFRVILGMEGAWTDGHPRPEGEIVVGNDVWIGAEALILPGVTIGDGAVIAGRAVVTRDVAPYAIVGGVPAREIRRRFSDEQIKGLLELQWWSWPEEVVRAHVDLLSSPDVDGLIAAGRARQSARRE
jgi:acetyltransferase-like isoleucine patch superfamily enzyme